MWKYVYLCIGILWSTTTFSKDKTDSLAPKYWKITGTNSLTGNQSSFSNWQLGGTNNITVNLRMNYDFNYQKGDIYWDNKAIVQYGFNRNKFSSLKKTEDKIEINSILAKKVDKSWFYSAIFNFKTQFDKSLDPKDPQKKVAHFLSPIFTHFGPGMFWRKSNNFKVNFSPTTLRFIFVHSEFTKMGKSFGVSQEKVMKLEFGASMYVYYNVNVMKNVNIENILGVFTNYIENTQDVDFNYQLNVIFHVNKFISANVNYEATYDNDIVEHLQQKQSIGIGLKYSF